MSENLLVGLLAELNEVKSVQHLVGLAHCRCLGELPSNLGPATTLHTPQKQVGPTGTLTFQATQFVLIGREAGGAPEGCRVLPPGGCRVKVS